MIALLHRHREVVMTTADGIAIGGGALTASLIDLLVEKEIIAKSDARTVIDRALARLVILDPKDSTAASEFIASVAQQVAARK
jgi:hypothetical protein